MYEAGSQGQDVFTRKMNYRLMSELLEMLRMEYRRGCDNSVLPLGMVDVLDEYDTVIPDDTRNLLQGYAEITTTEERQMCLKCAAETLERESTRIYGQTLERMSQQRRGTLTKLCVEKNNLIQNQRKWEQIPKKPYEPIEYTHRDGTPIGYRSYSFVDPIYWHQEIIEQQKRVIKSLRIRLSNQQ